MRLPVLAVLVLVASAAAAPVAEQHGLSSPPVFRDQVRFSYHSKDVEAAASVEAVVDGQTKSWRLEMHLDEDAMLGSRKYQGECTQFGRVWNPEHTKMVPYCNPMSCEGLHFDIKQIPVDSTHTTRQYEGETVDEWDSEETKQIWLTKQDASPPVPLAASFPTMAYVRFYDSWHYGAPTAEDYKLPPWCADPASASPDVDPDSLGDFRGRIPVPDRGLV